MKIFQSAFYILFIPLIILGCAKSPKENPPSVLESEKNFIKMMQEEYGTDVVVQNFNNSFWIYVPLQNEFFTYKSSREGPQKSTQSKKAFVINFLDGTFNNNIFSIVYDITRATKYEKNPGYSSSYTDEFSKVHRNITTALYRTFGHFEQSPDDLQFYQKIKGDVDFKNPKENQNHKNLTHSYVSSERAPNIFIIIISDIKSGLEMTMMVTLEDIKRGSTEQTFIEEYQRRFVYEEPIGHTDIVGDEKGSHVDFHDVSWGEFILKQILHRIRTKYQRSKYIPTDNIIQELTTEIKHSVDAYKFEDFFSINLKNLQDNSETIISKNELSKFQIPTKKSKGKLHVIKFDNFGRMKKSTSNENLIEN